MSPSFASPSVAALLLLLLLLLSSGTVVVLALEFSDLQPGSNYKHPTAACDGPFDNRIIEENCKPGNPSWEWDVNGAGDPTIQGFSTDISYNAGKVAMFKINTTATRYRVDIYRTGYYKGLGARKVDSIIPDSQPKEQPPCHKDPKTHIHDCANWAVSVKWPIPSDAVSGVYIARLVRTDDVPPTTWRTDNSQAGEDPRFAMPGGASMRRPQPAPHAYGANGMGRYRYALNESRASLIYFVVRNDDSKSHLVFQASDTVWQAYNHFGGTSTYGSYDPANPKPRCLIASYNRPLATRQVRPVNAYFGSEYPVVRFLERFGYDVAYIAAVDTDRQGVAYLLKHRVFLSVGHDEYWSGRQRKNIEAARDSGLHLAFFSGNEMYWRVRWEDDYRNMVVYKESQDIQKIDPNLTEWTGTFRDSRPINPLGANPENAVTGQIFTINAWRNDPLVVPYKYSHLRQWRETKIANLPRGSRAVLFRGILGHEMDEDVDNGFRPANMIRLSETPVDNCMYIQDFGSTYDSGSATHHLTLYKAPSGAIVFGAGTVQWGWALDGFHDSENGLPATFVNHLNTRIGTDMMAPEPTIQQFTVNLFADMNVPCPLCGIGNRLKATMPSTDTLPPTCRITLVRVEAPHGGQPADHMGHFSQVYVEAEAYDEATLGPDGVHHDGVVGGVEVAVKYSNRWHPLDRTERHFNEATESLADRYKRDKTHTGSRWTGYFDVGGLVHPDAPLTVECRATDDSLNTQLTPSVFTYKGKDLTPPTFHDKVNDQPESGRTEGDL